MLKLEEKNAARAFWGDAISDEELVRREQEARWLRERLSGIPWIARHAAQRGPDFWRRLYVVRMDDLDYKPWLSEERKILIRAFRRTCRLNWRPRLRGEGRSCDIVPFPTHHQD